MGSTRQSGDFLGRQPQWIYSTSFVPSRELSMLAAIGIQAAFQGRRYVGPTRSVSKPLSYRPREHGKREEWPDAFNQETI